MPKLTTWHKMAVSGFSNCPPTTSCIGLKFLTTYPSLEFQAGFWHYADDNSRWIASGFFGGVPPTPGVVPGTDLGGILWTHGTTTQGTTTHFSPQSICPFGPPCPPTNIVDAYELGVAPDRTTTSIFVSAPASTDDVVGPPPRSRFGAAFSRVADSVYVVGGVLDSGAAASDIWVEHDDTWTGVPLVVIRPRPT